MTLISLLVALIVIGVLLWLLNTYAAPYIDGKILLIINVVVTIVVVLWLLTIFGVLPYITLPIPRLGAR